MPRRFSRPIFCLPFVLAILAVPAPAAAQPDKLDNVLKQLEQLQVLSDVSISPDGRWIAWTQPAANNVNSEIYVAEWNNRSQQPERVSPGDSAAASQDSHPVWSPDSRSLIFLSNFGSSQEQVFLWTLADKRAKRLTDLKGHVKDARWSPDGTQIAFLYAEGGGGGGPLEAEPVQTGVIGSEIHNQRITIIKASGGSLQQLSPSDLNIYEYDWSPDGTRFAATAAPGPADNNWWIAKLYSVDRASGAMKLLYSPPAEQQVAVPRWSPDGKQVAFIGGLMSDEGFTGGDIFALSSDGGSPRNLTPGIKGSPSGLSWHDPHRIVFTQDVEGGSAITTLDPSTGQKETLWKGAENIHQDGNFPNFALARDGRTSVVVRSSWQRAPEVWAGPLGDWQQLTHVNTSQQLQWGKSESIVWSNDGYQAQGWLLYPQHFDPSKRYPMVVEIHGGPAGMRAASWPSARFDMSVLSGLGYFVFFPNPRGSYGEGESFTRANVKDFGHGDLRDILAGVDAVVRRVPIDENRIGVTGWSYGGFMTMWTVTQTTRFKAAVAGAGIANWQSYYGENSIDQWMIPYFGATVYDDPAVYAKSSPITYIKQVKTPTLVVVGERDGECPSPQSFEFWHALQTEHVPTQLVIYPGEGHSFHDPKNRLDVLRRTVEWFEKYLAPDAKSNSATAQ